jgi:hypothetical protein
MVLEQLTDAGFTAEIRGPHLLLHDVPYVTAGRTIARATLAFVLEPMAGAGANVSDHRAMWTGDYPCDRTGARLGHIENVSQRIDLGGGYVVQHLFSSKPPVGYYDDQFEQATTYAAIVANEARALDDRVTPRTRRAIIPAAVDSPFAYVDNATARARIDAVSRKLELRGVGIVGLGGTGSYILDLIAKTPVRRILIVDGDDMEQHNAFRAPGAVPLEALRRRPKKVDHWQAIYSAMHRGIETVAAYLDAGNLGILDGLDFVFLCMDPGPGKRLAIEHLEARKTPFIDCGMGLEHVEEVDAILGIVRVTTSVPGMRDHTRRRLALEVAGEEDLYARNIQVADLNMLNAALAVVRFKRHFGFYLDLEGEHHATYGIDGNRILNEDRQPTTAANHSGDDEDGRTA